MKKPEYLWFKPWQYAEAIKAHKKLCAEKSVKYAELFRNKVNDFGIVIIRKG